MQNVSEPDYFTDYEILKDPYGYFEEIRAKGPVHRLTERDIVVVTGLNEAQEVLRNYDDFSSAITPQGPTFPLPFQVAGDEITEQIEAHRDQLMGGDLLVALDDKRHACSRSILNKLFTPPRLQANEDYMRELANKLVKAALAKGDCEFMDEIATRFVTLVIADLLGVPEDDRELFMEVIANGPPAGNMDTDADISQGTSSLEFMGRYFAQYLMDRRANPRDDVLTELATTKYPDGSTPDMMEIVRLATFLFAAGQDTSAKLLGNSIRFIVDTPGLQQNLRDDPALIPELIEEVARLEGSTKATFRVARRKTKIGDMEIPVGQRVMVAIAAANRDPRRWEDPADFKLGREKIKEHLAFGRGPHICVGAPLARAEVRVMLECLFEHTAHIDISEEQHGAPGNRNFDYEPTFIIRGLEELHVKLTPASWPGGTRKLKEK